MNDVINIFGAGLAGCEAALQLSQRGKKVLLYDAKPTDLLPCYSLPSFAELVCNNSFASSSVNSPLGLLVDELRLLGSCLVRIADNCRVKDDAYLAVDKRAFSEAVTEELYKKGVCIHREKVRELPDRGINIIATGPLTDVEFADSISSNLGITKHHFADASSIIIDISSIDLNNDHVEFISDDLYLVHIENCIFRSFCELLRSSAQINHTVDDSLDFKKCLSMEELAKKSDEELISERFKYINQNDICLVLRRETALGNGFIMVGCTTTLRHGDQLKAISILPGFSKVRIIKYGRMHRNTFFDSPGLLDSFYKVKNHDAFIVGQLSGIDGYAPAISSGLVSSLRIVFGDTLPPFPTETMIGALANYVSNQNTVDFQPMCASFSLLKTSEKTDYYSTSMKTLNDYLTQINCRYENNS